MSELRQKLKIEIARRAGERFLELVNNRPGMNAWTAAARERFNSGAPRVGMGFAWGELIGGLVQTAGSTYAAKEMMKGQAQLAQSLSLAEAKKMEAETALMLAQTSSLQQQAALTAQQNELQKIIASMEFAGVQKWLLAGAGALTLLLIGMIVIRKAGESRRRK